METSLNKIMNFSHNSGEVAFFDVYHREWAVFFLLKYIPCDLLIEWEPTMSVFLQGSFNEIQKQRNVPLAPLLFESDSGNGLFNGIRYPFVLENAERNLWTGIRDEAIRYFNGVGLGSEWPKSSQCEQCMHLEADCGQSRLPSGIQFWKSGKGIYTINGEKFSLPTGHVLSSQVACINHLFPLIRDKDAATQLLHGLNMLVCEALPVNIHERGNYVEFEVTGGGSYLNEEKNGKPLRRGANCTSIDAVMKGRTCEDEIILFLIEWKYVEHYSSAKSKWDDERGRERQKRYGSFFTKDSTPFTFCNSDRDEAFFRQLFTEPYYQLMRQTLLGWQMVRDSQNNGGATSAEHLVVIPSCNHDLRFKSNPLGGNSRDVSENWNKHVKSHVCFIDPQSLFEPLSLMLEYSDWMQYLEKRYWQPSCTILERPPIQEYDGIRLLRDIEFIEDGKKYIAPKGLSGGAVEVWGNGEAYEFDSSLVIRKENGTLGSMFFFFTVQAEDVEIEYSRETRQYYPPTWMHN